MKRIYENKWLFDMLRATPIEGRVLTLWAEEEVEVLRPREHFTPPKEPPVKTHTTNNVPLQPQTIPVAPINSQATRKTPAVSAQNDNVIHHQNPYPEPPVINIYPKVDTESLISRLGLGRARLYRPVSALTLPTPRACLLIFVVFEIIYFFLLLFFVFIYYYYFFFVLLRWDGAIQSGIFFLVLVLDFCFKK